MKFVNEANKKIKEVEETANAELGKAKTELDKYKQELDNGKIKLDNAKIELNNTYNQLKQGSNELEKAKEELEQGNQKLIDGKKEIEDKLKPYNITYDKLNDFVKKYDSSSISIADMIKLFKSDIDIKEKYLCLYLE